MEKRLDTYKDLELRPHWTASNNNKVKQSLNLFDVIETIDREKIATEIAKNFHVKVKLKDFISKLILAMSLKKAE